MSGTIAFRLLPSIYYAQMFAHGVYYASPCGIWPLDLTEPQEASQHVI